jgi:hypothetical protein
MDQRLELVYVSPHLRKSIGLRLSPATCCICIRYEEKKEKISVSQKQIVSSRDGASASPKVVASCAASPRVRLPQSGRRRDLARAVSAMDARGEELLRPLLYSGRKGKARIGAGQGARGLQKRKAGCGRRAPLPCWTPLVLGSAEAGEHRPSSLPLPTPGLTVGRERADEGGGWSWGLGRMQQAPRNA